jgi:hypothetical protein
MRNAYKIVVGKSERKKPLEKTRRTTENNINQTTYQEPDADVSCARRFTDYYLWESIVISVINRRHITFLNFRFTSRAFSSAFQSIIEDYGA